VFSGADPGMVLASFEPYEGRGGGKLRGGVRVAAGDVNGDFLDDVVTVPGKGAEARVLAFNATQLLNPATVPLVDFVAFPGTKGVFLALGDVSGDGVLDYVVGSEKGSEVRVLDGDSFPPLMNIFGTFTAFPKQFRRGARVAVADVNGNGRADVVVASGKGSPTTIRVFDPTGDAAGPLAELLPYGPNDKRGAFVGALSR
jgi:hypothetical protein